MRTAAVTLTALGLFCLTGAQCQFLRPDARNALPPGTPPLVEYEAPRFVAWLNRQSDRLQSVRYDKVSVSAEGPDGSVRLRDGILVCAKPRNFRLIGDHLLKSEAFDTGSNDREFWMVVRQPEPTLLYCSHDDFARGTVNLPVPFDPDWVLQALGMTAFDPNLNYAAEVNQANRTYALSWDAATPQGEPIRKTVFFAGDRATREKPQVYRHEIAESGGAVIASADIKEVRSVPLADAPEPLQVPTRVTLEWPRQKFKMDLSLDFGRNGGVNVPLSEAESAYFFTRPQPAGVNPINLAEARFRPSSARGTYPDPDSPRSLTRR